jgi:hypothetical protein
MRLRFKAVVVGLVRHAGQERATALQSPCADCEGSFLNPAVEGPIMRFVFVDRRLQAMPCPWHARCEGALDTRDKGDSEVQKTK